MMAPPPQTIAERIEWRPIGSLVEAAETEFATRNVVIALWSHCDGLNAAWLWSETPERIVATSAYTYWATVKGPSAADQWASTLTDEAGNVSHYLGPAARAFRWSRLRFEVGYWTHRGSPYGTMDLEAEWMWASELRRPGVIREALTLLAAKFDREALHYRRKCRETRAEHYEDMAKAIRNHIDWTCGQMGRVLPGKETT